MANDEHLRKLLQGVDAWNQWRQEHPDVRVDLTHALLKSTYLAGISFSEVDLTEANLSKTNLRGADLHGAKLGDANCDHADLSRADLHLVTMSGANLTSADVRGANLYLAELKSAKLFGANLAESNCQLADLSMADLRLADLRRANLSEAELVSANLQGANLTGADFTKANAQAADFTMACLNDANLRSTNLSGAILREANLESARLLGTILDGADLTDCRVYGVSAWGIRLTDAIQTNLTITPSDEAAITVDNVEVAQFIYLLLSNEKIRKVIETVTSKVVLILGRFTALRKSVLDAVREHLRTCNYLPVVFDFDKPDSRNLTETVRTLAHLARFIIADITDPRSIPQELQAVVPFVAVPVQPIIERPQQPWGMFVDFPHTYHWVLAPYEYTGLADLLDHLQENVIAPAEAKARQLMRR